MMAASLEDKIGKLARSVADLETELTNATAAIQIYVEVLTMYRARHGRLEDDEIDIEGEFDGARADDHDGGEPDKGDSSGSPQGWPAGDPSQDPTVPAPAA